MPILNESNHTGEHIVSEANGTRSRDVLTVGASQTLVPGQVVAQLTAGGNVVAFDEVAVNGAEDPIGVMYSHVVTGAGETAAAVVHVRDCEVRASSLVWPDDIESGDQADAEAALKALGIILR